MIKNYEQLATTRFRRKVLDILAKGIDELDIKKIIREQFFLEDNVLKIKAENNGIKKYNLDNFSRVFLFGIGKGSAMAVGEIEKIINGRIAKGAVIDTKKERLEFVKFFKGTHPLPSGKNVRATKKIIKMLKEADSKDLVLFFVFGGASALFCAPAKISLRGLRKFTDQLIKSGKDIYQVNTVRKHLSRVKGGHIAELTYPAKLVSCIFSDVPGGDVSFIASGPTVQDKTSKKEAMDIAKELGWSDGIFVETPKQKKYFENTDNIMVFSNKKPLLEMKKKAQRMGFEAKIYSYEIKGEAKNMGKRVLKSFSDKKKPQLILAGGELTVTVRGKGKGGRNQEFVLGALNSLEENEIIISLASDGIDNTEAAGAIGDLKTKQKADEIGLKTGEYLENNNSFDFFNKTKDLIYTDRGVNVADIILIAKFLD